MDQCPATTSQYDHKAARAKMSEDDIQKAGRIVFEQTMEAHKIGVVDCAGEYKSANTGEIYRCPKRLMLIWMYRCWFCGKWLCPECAKAHFGER